MAKLRKTRGQAKQPQFRLIDGGNADTRLADRIEAHLAASRDPAGLAETISAALDAACREIDEGADLLRDGDPRDGTGAGAAALGPATGEAWRGMSAVTAAARLGRAASHAGRPDPSGRLMGIVKQHALGAFAAGLVPIPGVSVMASSANISAMYGRINRELGLALETDEGLAARVAASIGGASGAIGAGALKSGGLPLLPFVGASAALRLIGGSASYGVTMVAAAIYMNAIAALLERNAPEIHEVDVRPAIEAEMQDEAALRGAFKTAARDYYKLAI